MLVIQDFRGKINEEQARAILKESAELGNLLHDEEEPQVFEDQPRPVIGLKHGHKPASGRTKIKIAGTSKLLGKGIIPDEEIDELA